MVVWIRYAEGWPSGGGGVLPDRNQPIRLAITGVSDILYMHSKISGPQGVTSMSTVEAVLYPTQDTVLLLVTP